MNPMVDWRKWGEGSLKREAASLIAEARPSHAYWLLVPSARVSALHVALLGTLSASEPSLSDRGHKTRARQVAHLRLLAENYDGIDAEEWAEAADTIEILQKQLRHTEEDLYTRLAAADRRRAVDAKLIEEAYAERNAATARLAKLMDECGLPIEEPRAQGETFEP